MKIIGIIPARMSSSRFPGKPMKKIYGVPMIGHCYLRSKFSKKLDHLFVATPDKIIFDYIKSIGGDVIMTSHKHDMCNDRVFEAVDKIEKLKKIRYNIIVNIQGDLPLVYPDMIDSLIKPLEKNKKISNTTMIEKITSYKDFKDPNRVKVTISPFNKALLFTRESIPSDFKMSFKKFTSYKHVALRAYNRKVFELLKVLKITPLEKIEGVDDLRLLEHDIPIHVVLTNKITDTVDNKKDLLNVKKIMKNDIFKNKY
tara:strand:+ start:654 stop:1421 length:768 start_codon:yes stop_codon:yes gene_type:complete